MVWSTNRVLPAGKIGVTRVVVLGGAGNFGARIVRALQADPNIELVSAGRRAITVPGAPGVRTAVLDVWGSDFARQLALLQPGLVIHCVGPFQGQDYRVARAALSSGAHYLDLADGRDFVADFAAAMNADAARAGRVAISGASTLPALSTAVIDALREGLSLLEVEIAIAPGQKAPRGAATLAAVFSYLGRPVQVWEDRVWRERFGWMDLRRFRFMFGSRWGALCDVPDLALLPARYPTLRTVRFHAALEFGVQHLVLWKLAAIRRLGLPIPVDRVAVALNRLAGAFDGLAGQWGGMRVSVLGRRVTGETVRRTWLLTVPAMDGPEIPCMAAILLARRIAGGGRLPAGSFPCMGFVSLAEFAAEFARWGITTHVEERAA
jgi:hypothetical protein